MQPGSILTFYEMCAAERLGMIQKGMTFRAPPEHGVILMSLRPNAPYEDAIDLDGTLIYEGHDTPKSSEAPLPKLVDQPRQTKRGAPTENGKFADWTDRFKLREAAPAMFHVYEKLQDGIWNFRGPYLLVDYDYARAGNRKVFKFQLKPVAEDAESQPLVSPVDIDDLRTRQIPTAVKQEVYKRDRGQCVLCGSKEDLHFDHELPYSKGGSSNNPANIRILCGMHNLAKGAKIE